MLIYIDQSLSISSEYLILIAFEFCR